MASTQVGSPREGKVSSAGSHRVEVVGSFNMSPLEPIIAFWFREMWPVAAVDFAPYGQLLEQIFGTGRILGRSSAAERVATLVLLRPEDLLRSDGRLPRSNTALLATAKAHLLEIVDALAQLSLQMTLILGLFPASDLVRSGPTLNEFDRWARATVTDAIERAPSAHLALLDDLESLYEVREVDDPFRDEFGHIPFTDEYFAAAGTALVRCLRALWEPPRKVIALDCDNTLWGGACSEDGIDSLELGGPYAELRRFMLHQAESGRLLCLVSRNPESKALGAVRQCGGPLELNHIAAHRIRPSGAKSESLRSLAGELELSLDSFVFVDDDPVECAEVRAALPSVAVVELPRDPADIPMTLRHAWEFDVLAVTDEDRRRSTSYATEAQRRRERIAAPSVREFVEGLEVQVEFDDLDSANVERAAQILSRTNQFNLTGARWSENELLNQSHQPENEVLVIRVRDRLGDYGSVGVASLEKRGTVMHMAVLALSCRVLNRGVEARILQEAGKRAGINGCLELSIAFQDTGRNAPAAAMLGKLFFCDVPPPGADLQIDLKALRMQLPRLRPGRFE